MRKQIIGDLDFLHSNIGVVEGTIALLLIWLALALIERRGRSLGPIHRQIHPSTAAPGTRCVPLSGLARATNRQKRHLVKRQQ